MEEGVGVVQLEGPGEDQQVGLVADRNLEEVGVGLMEELEDQQEELGAFQNQEEEEEDLMEVLEVDQIQEEVEEGCQLAPILELEELVLTQEAWSILQIDLQSTLPQQAGHQSSLSKH